MTPDQASQMLQLLRAIYEALRFLLYISEAGLFFLVLYIAARFGRGLK